MTVLQQIIKDIRNLTPIPAVVNQIVAMVDDPAVSMDDIARIIQYDPAMTANIIRTCNSAYFGLRNPVESVKDAVSILGIDQIVELVLLKIGAQNLNKSQKGYQLEKGAMWRYSVSSALIAKGLAETICPENKNTIFTAALLKDIGKTILDRLVSDCFENIDHLVKKEGYSFREAEKKVIGIDHAELGAMITKMWKFSPNMVRIIRHHHLAEESMRKDKDIAIVYLADCICMMMGIGVGADGLAYRFHSDVVRDLQLNSEDLAQIIAGFTLNMQQVEELLKAV